MVTQSRIQVERDGGVVTLRMKSTRQLIAAGTPGGEIQSVHESIGIVLEELRPDSSVRVIVLTGAADDSEFHVAPPPENYVGKQVIDRLVKPEASFAMALGIIRANLAMAQIEKPVVARVNGDASGFGQSLIFASDIIVARKDALICDVHLGMGENKTSAGGRTGPRFGISPGDGAGAWAPLFMAPPIAKEYLMLSRQYTAEEMAQRGMINYAVEPADLDRKVNEIVQELLKRPAAALAWTKRVANTHVIQQLNATLTTAALGEMLDLQFYHHESQA